MYGEKSRYFWLYGLVFVCLIGFGCTNAVSQEEVQVRYADLGSETDGNQDADIWLSPTWAFSGGENFKYFIRYENENEFYWATKPNDPTGYITSRVQKSWYAGVFHVKAFDKAPNKVSIAIRYKDNLVSPVSVWANVSHNYKQIGSLEGNGDHAWKTAVLTVNGKSLTQEKGYYLFRIGRGDYGDLMGDLPLDWVKVSTGSLKAGPAVPGFYPKRPVTQFDNLAKTQVYRKGAKPLFPVGVCIKGLRTVTFRQVAEAGLTGSMLLGWETSWGPHKRVYSLGKWTDRLSAGLPNALEYAQSAEVFHLPCFFTDTRSYWIQHQSNYGSERAVLNMIRQAISMNARHPALLAWFLKDEADHDDSTWGAPEEFVQQIYNIQKEADPSRPAFVNFQGWKPMQYPRYIDAADILGFDVYPVGKGQSGRAIAEFTDRVRNEVAGRRAIWAIVEGHEGVHRKQFGRQLTETETVAEGYLAITHGIQGLWYYIDDEAEYIDPTEMPEPWNGIKRMAHEVFDEKEGLHPYLVPPGKFIHIADCKKANLASNSLIHVAIMEGPDGSQILVAVNEDRQEAKNVRIRWSGVKEGQELPVRFEDRTITAGNEMIVDDFGPMARHVYYRGGLHSKE